MDSGAVPRLHHRNIQQRDEENREDYSVFHRSRRQEIRRGIRFRECRRRHIREYAYYTGDGVLKFFSTSADKLRKSFVGLFGAEEKEIDPKTGKPLVEEGPKGGFNTKWNSFILIDTVSETQRISWQEATNLNVYEFFNTFSYAVERARYKEKLQKEAYDKIKSKRH